MQKNYKGAFPEFSDMLQDMPEMDLDNHPIAKVENGWQLLMQGNKLGIGGIKRFFVFSILFVFLNTAFFLFALVWALAINSSGTGALFALLVLLIGVTVTIYAIYKGYNTVILNASFAIYKSLEPVFKKITAFVVIKSEAVLKNNVNANDQQLKKALDFGQMIHTNFSRIPMIIRRIMISVLNRIPFVGMIMEIKDEIIANDNVSASEKLYSKSDAFVQNAFNSRNGASWAYQLLMINIVVQASIIYFKII